MESDPAAESRDPPGLAEIIPEADRVDTPAPPPGLSASRKAQ
jgi:hypothetical protein